MPGARRSIPRTPGTTGPPINIAKVKEREASATNTSSFVQDVTSSEPPSTVCMQPRHAHIPDVEQDSNLVFEAMIFVYSVMALGLQYINLYKTVWWLPHSTANYALNFYLIDPYLSVLLVVIISRRLVYCFVAEVKVNRAKHRCFNWLLQLIKLLVLMSVSATFVFSAYHVVLTHPLVYSLFLCYPLATYLVLFGFTIRPLFGRCNPPKPPLPASPEKSTSPSSTPKHRPRLDLLMRDFPTHVCSLSPEHVREEVEILKTDFNCRIKQVLFNSMLCAYYVGFVPLCFAQNVQNNCETCWNTLYYDTWWVGQHVVLIWISAFVFFMIHLLPARYIDVLHRCALHLGRWVKVESRNAHVPYNAWSELQVWQHGALVKHVRGLFKAEGINNSAEPGNGTHTRFYFVFHSPLRVTNWLLVITWSLVGYEFLILIQATEWSHVLSLAFLLLDIYYVLFKLMRDRFLLARSYKDEHQANSQNKVL